VSEEQNAKSKEQEEEDFNEANLHRFQRINFWMQNHKDEWKDSTFGRDRLCTEVGLNRHLVLQSVRSQGFNNVHDYISSFRVAELKRMISRGEVKTLNDTLAAGFGTTQTVRACFLKVEGITLDEFLKL
jgi:AraC-like DNA-binding protein